MIPSRRVQDIPDGSLPGQCRILCGRCFALDFPTFNETNQRFRFGTTEWDVTSNPMSWGAKNPRFLLLGVSKGPNQIISVADPAKHSVVAFDGLRETITEALRLLGLMRHDETVEQKIRPTEVDWAFGSVVRCSLGTVDEHGKVHKTQKVVGRWLRWGKVIAGSKNAYRPTTASYHLDWKRSCFSQMMMPMLPRAAGPSQRLKAA
jgi:hypothetical protein